MQNFTIAYLRNDIFDLCTVTNFNYQMWGLQLLFFQLHGKVPKTRVSFVWKQVYQSYLIFINFLSGTIATNGRRCSTREYVATYANASLTYFVQPFSLAPFSCNFSTLLAHLSRSLCCQNAEELTRPRDDAGMFSNFIIMSPRLPLTTAIMIRVSIT